jgi:biotin operon repressor
MEINSEVKKYLLLKKKGVFASDIADHFGIRKDRVYRIIRYLVEDGFGIETTSRGYSVSKFASQRDDLNFLTKLNGQMRNIDTRIRASHKDIVGRWGNKLNLCLTNMFNLDLGATMINIASQELLNLSSILDKKPVSKI